MNRYASAHSNHGQLAIIDEAAQEAQRDGQPMGSLVKLQELRTA
jgi:hypothetical protein